MLSHWASHDNGLPMEQDMSGISMDSGWPEPRYSSSLISQMCASGENRPNPNWWRHQAAVFLKTYSLHTYRAVLSTPVATGKLMHIRAPIHLISLNHSFQNLNATNLHTVKWRNVPDFDIKFVLDTNYPNLHTAPQNALCCIYSIKL